MKKFVTMLAVALVVAMMASIGSSAFYGCNSLEKLHIKSENPPVTGSWFKEDCENCTLYIPQGCKTTYINAGEPWTLFKDIIEE